MKGFYVLDADGHVGETTKDGWLPARYLPRRFNEEAPQYLGVIDNSVRFQLEGEVYPRVGGKGTAISGAIKGGSRMVDRPEGLTNPAKRIVDMDCEGIDVSVLFGGLACMVSGSFKNPEFGAAMARAYNEWVAEFCAHDPRRLKAGAALPYQDIAAAQAELRRAVRDHGLVGAAIAPNLNGMHLGDRYFDPIYNTSADLDIPVCVHGSAPRPGIHVTGMDLFDNFFFTHMPHHCFDQMLAMLAVMGGGVLDRFPSLRFAFLEGMCGWVPFWIERMEHHYEKLGDQVEMRLRPTEYLQSGQVFVATDPDEQTLSYVIQRFGVDPFIYASDYWHWDGGFPETVNAVLGRDDLTPGQKEAVLGSNASRLFGLPVPTTVS